jgi:ATP-dependent exoDNAse (exonuclease V) alpha subunit
MNQKEALDLLLMGDNVFLTGQAGSGKTYLLNQYVAILKQYRVGVAVTASTGIAATHLDGMTIHSWSGIGIKDNLGEKDVHKLLVNHRLRERVTSAKVLIIDEISMLHSYRLDMVNQVCKLIRQDVRPFGGLQVVICGDFFQLPPVSDSGHSESCFAYLADSWNELDLKVCYLTEQHRQWDEDLLGVLNNIRNSDLSEGTFEKLAGRLNRLLPKDIVPTKLYTHNVDVDAINNFELGKIDKPVHSFAMQSAGNPELIEMLKKGCLAPDPLVVKEGALVMFVKNNPGRGYINGTMGKVMGFEDAGYPVVKSYTGQEIVAVPTSWTVEEDDKILAEISQVPLRLAWAITVHKSQGMTLDAAEIDLSKTFTYGMGYVALSRVKSLEGIRLLGINPLAFQVDQQISEIDIRFKKLSGEVTSQLKSLRQNEIKSKQKEYLKNILPEESGESLRERTIKELFAKFFS